MKTTWALQDAKNKFSELIDHAIQDGPQTITRRGKKTAVILSTEEFRRLTAGQENLVDFLRDSPLRGAELDLERSTDLGREVVL